MNPAKRKKLYRAELAKEANKQEIVKPVLVEKPVEVVAPVVVEEPKLGLQEITKEEPILVNTVVEQPITTTKKKKV